MQTNEIQVSTVIVQYNPCLKKVMRTIYSVAQQEKINNEIIIADDGSKEDYFDELENLLKQLGVKNYAFVKNKINQGTVKNLLSGFYKANGKYIYAISPGDMLFDKETLWELYDFSERNKAICTFGNAIYFEEKDDIYIKKLPNQPEKPQIFSTNMPRCFGKLAMAEGMNICGASYFREREYAIKYVSGIANTAKYVEDTTSALLSLIDGKRIVWFDRNVIWYECGSGISTSSNPVWMKRIQEDVSNTRLEIEKKYRMSHVLKFVNIRIEGSKYPILKKIVRSLKYPVLTCVHIFNQYLFENKMTAADAVLERRLKCLIALADKCSITGY